MDSNWWNRYYDEESIEEISSESGQTEDEIQAAIDDVLQYYSDYSFVSFVTANEDYEDILFDAGLDKLVVVSDGIDEMLCEMAHYKLIDVSEDVRHALALDDDVDDDIEDIIFV